MSLRENLRLAAEKRFIQTYLYGPSHVYDTDDKDKITEHIQAQLKKLFNHRYDNLSYLDVNLTEEQSNDWGELRWAGFRPPFRRNIKKWMILSRNNVIGCKAEGRRRLYQMNAAVLDEEYEFNKTLPLSSLDKEELYNSMGKFGIPEEETWNLKINNGIREVTTIMLNNLTKRKKIDDIKKKEQKAIKFLVDNPSFTIPVTNECSICQLDCGDNPISCGHHFHTSCLLKWTHSASRMSHNCPNCREPIQPQQSFPQHRRGGGNDIRRFSTPNSDLVYFLD
jgi:hypothetical protein